MNLKHLPGLHPDAWDWPNRERHFALLPFGLRLLLSTDAMTAFVADIWAREDSYAGRLLESLWVNMARKIRAWMASGGKLGFRERGTWGEPCMLSGCTPELTRPFITRTIEIADHPQSVALLEHVETDPLAAQAWWDWMCEHGYTPVEI